MIQEYLFMGKDDRQKIEQYSYGVVKIETYDIDNSDCWVATFTLDGKGKDSANTLSAIDNYIMNNFHPTVLSNGCSAYYNKALYPYFNEFERKLRKLLYLKSALNKDTEEAKTIKDLESKDFGEIFTLLFADSKFIQKVKQAINDKTWQYTKAEILATIQQIPEQTIWDTLIGKDAVPSLRSDFMKVKGFRNAVMHAHSMDTKLYNSALALIKKINEQLDEEIGKIIGEKEDGTQSVSNQDFNAILSEAIKDMNIVKCTESWQEHLIAAFKECGNIINIPKIVEVGESIAPQFAAIRQSNQES